MYIVWNRLLDGVAPRRCGGCDRAGAALCAGCAAGVAALPRPPILALGRLSVRAAFPYRDGVARLVHRAKYRDGRTLLRELAALAAMRLPAIAGTLLVPVPLGPSRRRQRGYNQAELLAAVLAASGCGDLCAALVRVRETAPQVGRDAAAREANVAGAFAWRGPSLEGARCAVIDDVVTTGATVSAAARALAAAGAGPVSALALARRI